MSVPNGDDGPRQLATAASEEAAAFARAVSSAALAAAPYGTGSRLGSPPRPVRRRASEAQDSEPSAKGAGEGATSEHAAAATPSTTLASDAGGAVSRLSDDPLWGTLRTGSAEGGSRPATSYGGMSGGGGDSLHRPGPVGPPPRTAPAAPLARGDAGGLEGTSPDDESGSPLQDDPQALLCAQLSARQFLGGIVLGACLRLGPGSRGVVAAAASAVQPERGAEAPPGHAQAEGKAATPAAPSGPAQPEGEAAAAGIPAAASSPAASSSMDPAASAASASAPAKHRRLSQSRNNSPRTRDQNASSGSQEAAAPPGKTASIKASGLKAQVYRGTRSYSVAPPSGSSSSSASRTQREGKTAALADTPEVFRGRKSSPAAPQGIAAAKAKASSSNAVVSRSLRLQPRQPSSVRAPQRPLGRAGSSGAAGSSQNQSSGDSKDGTHTSEGSPSPPSAGAAKSRRSRAAKDSRQLAASAASGSADGESKSIKSARSSSKTESTLPAELESEATPGPSASGLEELAAEETEASAAGAEVTADVVAESSREEPLEEVPGSLAARSLALLSDSDGDAEEEGDGDYQEGLDMAPSGDNRLGSHIWLEPSGDGSSLGIDRGYFEMGSAEPVPADEERSEEQVKEEKGEGEDEAELADGDKEVDAEEDLSSVPRGRDNMQEYWHDVEAYEAVVLPDPQSGIGASVTAASDTAFLGLLEANVTGGELDQIFSASAWMSFVNPEVFAFEIDQAGLSHYAFGVPYSAPQPDGFQLADAYATLKQPNPLEAMQDQSAAQQQQQQHVSLHSAMHALQAFQHLQHTAPHPAQQQQELLQRQQALQQQQAMQQHQYALQQQQAFQQQQVAQQQRMKASQYSSTGEPSGMDPGASQLLDGTENESERGDHGAGGSKSSSNCGVSNIFLAGLGGRNGDLMVIRTQANSATEPEQTDVSQSADDGGTTGLQLRSVKLLRDLELCPASWLTNGRPVTPVSPRTPGRPRRPANVGRGGAIGGGQAKLGSGTESRPDWNSALHVRSERGIPQYDALIDEHCPIMSSPHRLKHLLRTRELSSEYHYVVRARFERHRELFDNEGHLGERTRPVPAPKVGESVSEQDRSVMPGEEGMERPRPRASTKAGMALLCCPEWCGSSLHYEVLGREVVQQPAEAPVEVEQQEAGPFYNLDAQSQMQQPRFSTTEDAVEEEEAADAEEAPSEAAESAIADPNAVPSEVLKARWERLRARVEELWPRLQVAESLQVAMTDGPLLRVSPESVHRLEVHLKELLDFRAETLQLIGAWIQRAQILDSIRGTHALGVNDDRLTSLKLDLQRLNMLSTSLIRSIGAWSRRFSHIVVDVTKAAPQKPRPRAVFVWQGHDCVERVHSDFEALGRGRLPAEDGNALAQATGAVLPEGGDGGESAEGATSIDGADDFALARGGFAASAPDSKGTLLCPLVASTIAAQSFSVPNVLHEGPPPPWFKKNVAHAGIKALKRKAIGKTVNIGPPLPSRLHHHPPQR